jgi:hypothetical protein
MQAITVKYLGPTDTKDARYSAKCDAGSIIVGYDHGLNTTDNVKAAVKALCDKLGWQWKDHPTLYRWHIGQDHKGNWQAVCVDPFNQV